MKIALDLDGVVFSTFSEVFRIWRKRYDDEPDVRLYNFGDFDRLVACLHELHESGGLAKLRPSIACMDFMCNVKDHEIHFCTDRRQNEMADTVRCLKDSDLTGELWFTNCPIEPGSTTRSKAKFCINEGFDLLVDDSPRVCAEAHSLGLNTVVFDRPYNTFINIPRAFGWETSELGDGVDYWVEHFNRSG